jgi:hypothetical protein
VSPDQRVKADSILADASNPEIARQKILHRASELGQALGGDERHALVEACYRLLAERDAAPGSNVLYGTHSTFD